VHGALGRAARLTEEQKWALVQESAHGRWRTYAEARDWVQEHYGVGYGYKGLYSVLRRAGVRPKVALPAGGAGGCLGPGGVGKGGAVRAP